MHMYHTAVCCTIFHTLSGLFLGKLAKIAERGLLLVSALAEEAHGFRD